MSIVPTPRTVPARAARGARTVGLAAALAAALVACGGHQQSGDGGAAPPVRATVSAAARIALPAEVEVYGSVEPARSVALSSRVMATVRAVHVQMGDAVETGQVLVEIDPATTGGQLAQARGALAQAEASDALARRNLQRFEALAATQAASELELDMARMQAETAQGAVEQARGAVQAAGSVAAESKVAAPFDGRVAARLVEPGDLAAPGRPLVRLESTGAHRLALVVPETVFAVRPLAAGTAVPVAIDSRPDLGRLDATVVEVSPGADAATHSYIVKVDLGGREVPSGAAGRGWVPQLPREAVVVPTRAVLRQGGATFVAVREGDGTAGTRVVTLGQAIASPDGGVVEVLSGLAGGEEVLLGLEAAPPLGTPVEVAP